MLTHLSLFSGIGGIDLAAHWSGFETIAFVERDAYCQKVLAKNFPGVPIHNDVTTFDATEFRGVDLISGGFPCQPHSVIGSRRASGDSRDLWGEFMRIVRESEPRWVLGENVRGLLSSEGGRFFGRVLRDLADAGYSVAWDCVSAADAGAPHPRERVFIVARNMADSPRLACHVKSVASRPRRARAPIGTGGGPRRRDWIPQPGLCRVVDGLSRGLDHGARLRALGNAVVPQQVYPILQAIALSTQENPR